MPRYLDRFQSSFRMVLCTISWPMPPTVGGFDVSRHPSTLKKWKGKKIGPISEVFSCDISKDTMDLLISCGFTQLCQMVCCLPLEDAGRRKGYFEQRFHVNCMARNWQINVRAAYQCISICKKTKCIFVPPRSLILVFDASFFSATVQLHVVERRRCLDGELLKWML